MNRSYMDLRDALITTINNSGLELGASYYILKDVTNLVFEKYSEEVQRERDEMQQYIDESVAAETLPAETSEDSPEPGETDV